MQPNSIFIPLRSLRHLRLYGSRNPIEKTTSYEQGTPSPNAPHIASQPQATPRNRAQSGWLSAVGVATFGTLLTCWLGGRTGELLLDFSRELYVSWQIADGKILYRDLDYRFGPLAVCANGLWMRLFGAGLTTVRMANLGVLITTCVLLYALLVKMADRLTASVGTLVFLCVFGVGSGTMLTQYNFLTPYNHGATYGLMLSLAALLFVGRYCRTGRAREAAGACFLTGLCFLTKPEMFLACAAAVGCGLTSAAIGYRYRIGRAVLVCTAAFVVPPIVAFAAFAHFMSWRTALAGTMGGWQFVSTSRLVQSPFYRWCLGTDDLYRNIALMLTSAAAWSVGIAVVALIARAVRNRRTVATILAAGMACVTASLLLLDERPGLGNLAAAIRGNIDRALPLVIAAAIGIWGWRLWRSRGKSLTAAHVLRFSFAVLSLLLLLKILFFARTSHYGFVLAAPATMTIIVILLYAVPSRLGPLGRSAWFFRFVVIGLLVGIVARRLVVTDLAVSSHQDKVHLELGGTMYLLPQDSAALGAIARLDKLIPPNGTLAVFPDSAGLNYATGRASSIPFTVFNPFELQMTGEITVINALRDSPPDFIAIVDTDESEYGSKIFGVDFGVAIQVWINQNYSVCAPESASDPKEVNRRIAIYRRNH